MNSDIMSGKLLLALHNAIRNAFEEDERLVAAGSEKIYCVKEFSDWKKTADELETAMRKQKVDFTPISWR
ncbi:MAG: hypothetical protein ACYDFU_00370 [Nitrospirota bacterium]